MNREYDGHFGKPKSEVRPNLDRYIREKAFACTREEARMRIRSVRCNAIAIALQRHLNTV